MGHFQFANCQSLPKGSPETRSWRGANRRRAGESTWFGLGDDATWTALTGLAETKNICQSENDINIYKNTIWYDEKLRKTSEKLQI